MPDASNIIVLGPHAYVAGGVSLYVLPAQCRYKKVSVAIPNGPNRTPIDVLSTWPNPASGSVSLHFDLPSRESATVRILDVRGRQVRTFVTDSRSSGERSLTWDGTDDRGRLVAAGTYFVRLDWREGAATSRVVLIR
ncbi:MAG: FlgD immunoglobulin-like domain containing protein [bacterium]